MDVRGIVVRFSTKATGRFSSKTSEIILELIWHYTGYRICFHLPISFCLEINNDWIYTLLPHTFIPLYLHGVQRDNFNLLKTYHKRFGNV